MHKIIFIILLLFSFNTQASQKEYNKFVDELKEELIEKGANKKLVKKVYKNNFYKEKPETIKLDKKQKEFSLTSEQYLNKVINDAKKKRAITNYHKKEDVLKKVHQKYGVQPQILTSFWGLETNFGSFTGNFYAFEALTQLAFDKRRRTFFKNQLFYLFKIVEKNDLNYKKVKSSWAGAMGHFQFMPSTWYSYGSGDIVNNFEDAAFSAGKYLKESGWKKDEAWGDKVSLPKNFDYNLAGRLKKKKSIQDWKKLGVKTKLKNKYKASLIMPDGKNGPAYLVTNNFDVIMKWNRSQNYAISVGSFADYIKNNK